MLFAGGASFWSLVPICNNIVKGDATPWYSLQTVGLLAAAIALRTLFIAVRIRDLLVCLEEADELRKKRQSALAARGGNIQSLGMGPVIKGPFIQSLDRI